jgi:phenylacetate-CoA ligase
MEHEQVKAFMLGQYHRWRHMLHKRLLYHPDMFVVKDCLRAGSERRAGMIDLRLRRILSIALTHIPFYRNRVKLTPADVATEPLAALIGCFPYTDKAQVMECQSDFLDERLNTRFLHYSTSHGSTGTGIGVWRSKRESDIEKAFYMHEWGKLGFDFDSSRHVRIGYDAARPLDASPVWRQGRRLMVSPDHLQPRHAAAIGEAIRRFRPGFIHAYPSAALALAELLPPAGLGIELRGILLASEPAAAGQLDLIGRAFRAPVSISYGLTERTNLAFSSHADGINGPYRFVDLYGWTEARPHCGRSEIVGTSLWNECMPLIRYCTGDFADIGADGTCCAIEGRLQEFVVDRDGNRLPGLTIALAASVWDFVVACQLHQHTPGKVTLRVIPRNPPLTPEQQHALLAGPRSHWGRTIEFDCVEVPELARSPGGKHCFVINDLLRPRGGGNDGLAAADEAPGAKRCLTHRAG